MLNNEAIPFLLGNVAPLGHRGGTAFGCVEFAHCGCQGSCRTERWKAGS